MRKLKTTADLVGLPGWTVDPTSDDPDAGRNAHWIGYGVAVAVVLDTDSEQWEVTVAHTGEEGPFTFEDETDAVAYALESVAILNAVAANALAAAANPDQE
jgi:hypothetical protein